MQLNFCVKHLCRDGQSVEELIPVIVQEVGTNRVLMLGYMNTEAFRLTGECEQVVFWSRSREELWHKGATSGNVFTIMSWEYDCDGDTLLYQVRVESDGNACHRKSKSCFDFVGTTDAP